MSGKFLGEGPRFFILVLRGISIALSVFYIVAFAVDVAPILGSYENVNLFLDRMLMPLGYVLGIWIIYSISAMIINFLIKILQGDSEWFRWGEKEDESFIFEDSERSRVRPLSKVQTFRWNGGYVSMGNVPYEIIHLFRPWGSILSNTLSTLGYGGKRSLSTDGKIKFKIYLAPDFNSVYFRISRRPFGIEWDQLDDDELDTALSTAVGKNVDHLYIPSDGFYYRVAI